MPKIPAPGMLKQKDCCEFKASMGYIARPCLETKKQQKLGAFLRLKAVIWESGVKGRGQRSRVPTALLGLGGSLASLLPILREAP